jgi:hypothetical protein
MADGLGEGLDRHRIQPPVHLVRETADPEVDPVVEGEFGLAACQ